MVVVVVLVSVDACLLVGSELLVSDLIITCHRY